MSKDILIDKQKLIRTLIDNTPIAYIIMDDTNRIHYVNESFLKLRGLEWDKTVGELCYNISNGGETLCVLFHFQGYGNRKQNHAAAKRYFVKWNDSLY